MSVQLKLFDCFPYDIASKVHHLGSDTIKVMLSDTLPLSSNLYKSDITEISAGNGYSAGGAAVSGKSLVKSAGLTKWVVSGPTFTASGGSIAQFRYGVIYNDTATNKNLIGWYDRGVETNITVGNSYTVQFDATKGAARFYAISL